MNTISYFEIQAADVPAAVAFYQNVFGWKFIELKGMPIEYYIIETETMSGGLLKRPAKTPPAKFGTNAFTCSINVNDFDTTTETILNNGGKIAFPKFPVPGKCWQGYFTDTDNNTFGIFEVDENAGL